MDKQIVLIKGGEDWAGIQDMLGNAVVQIFSQVGKFNWVEPYKIEAQFENRGSGFLINEDGYLITNAHVVNEAKRIWIHIPILGRQNVSATIVGFSPERDLALLRIEPEELKQLKSLLGGIPFLTFGDSDLVRRTDNILVLGYPLGQYRLKSSTGVVSGRESGPGQALIQITAPINPGNSGGPLLNSQGQVVGITIAGVLAAQNVGYAIPINELKLILDELYTKQLVHKPVLGVKFTYASDEKAQYLGNPVPAGLYISRVFKNSLFEKAGIQEGDMLYEFNGFLLDAYGDTAAPWGADKTAFPDLIARIKLGEQVHCVIYRRGERKEIRFTFELLPPYSIRAMYPDYENIDYEIIGGLVIMQLADNHFDYLFAEAPDLIKYTQIEHKIDPVLVIAHVLPGSLSQQLRTLAPGDIVIESNGKKLSTLDSLRRAIRKSVDSGYLTLKTERDVFAAFSIHKLLEDEPRMSKNFSYPMSKVVQEMIKRMAKKEKGVA